MLTVYSYHPETKEYLGEQTPYISIGTGIPAGCTLVAPAVAETGFVYCWNGKEWVKTENHRGETVYNEADASPFEIKQLGPLPDGYTELVPPALTQVGETLNWEGSAWQIVPPSVQQQALSKYQQGISQCSSMAPQGKTPSDQMQNYYQSLWEIAYPQTKKVSARVQLNAVKVPVQTLPTPPAGLGDPNDPDSGWWA
ncbi:tail protein [Lasius niger]|uniref:Tail protein n=1 Tax=Lasius niger TaxID=67767 RepID=A0A0J7KHY7_LASNI|nr:tail protein [Lasius niger]